jgi:hypothetical protein
MTSRQPPKPSSAAPRRRWSVDQVERLGARFERGETARQIAESVGGVSKSTIASLLWRSGFLRKEAD